jgi:hypothetical protein
MSNTLPLLSSSSLVPSRTQNNLAQCQLLAFTVTNKYIWKIGRGPIFNHIQSRGRRKPKLPGRNQEPIRNKVPASGSCFKIFDLPGSWFGYWF